ncbi:MAG TPA: Mu transposase C-terminal domain-containing protein [Candidatus Rubrimentiphilum sp.]|nr:Mu transposase C-terminal domain-containing protein [Candidatus Rubrimentiphilum sp.]
MIGHHIERGAEVECDGLAYIVEDILSLDFVVARGKVSGQRQQLPVHKLKLPQNNAIEQSPVPDLSEIEQGQIDEARKRRDAIKPLLEMHRRRRVDVEEIAKSFGVDTTTIYRWMRAYRETGKLSSLMPPARHGGRGKSRLAPETEEIIKFAIDAVYLKGEQRTIKATGEEVARVCRDRGMKPPDLGTVSSRIHALSLEKRMQRRAHSKDAYNRFAPRPGKFEEAQQPLAMVEIDHTPMDIEIVDERDRLPIGKPYITIALDVYSRMIVGIHISLEAPSALTAGLCLVHAILPKETWLAKIGVGNKWPCWSFPAKIRTDNAQEFKSETLTLACEQYGIEIDYRPIGVPHFGGPVERSFRTFSREIHNLPGQTASNPKQKGDYDSEKMSALTLAELEKYVTEWVTGVYHQNFHSGIQASPIRRWTDGILGTKDKLGIGLLPIPPDQDRLRIDFLPLIRKTVQHYGVRMDWVHYYSDVLRPYIGQKGQFVFRRDPRDISKIYFWDPALKQYSEIPYRNLNHPPISVWELRKIRDRLREEGRAHIDEEAIFASHERLRLQRDQAVSETKKARRNRARLQYASGARPLLSVVPSPPTEPPRVPTIIRPYEIEITDA